MFTQHTVTARNWNKSFTHITFVPNQLAVRVWCPKSKSSIWIFTSVLVDSSPRSYLFPNTWSHRTEVWHRTFPICDAPLSRFARLLSVTDRNRAEINALVCTQALSGMVFVRAQELSVTVWTYSLRQVCMYTCTSSSSEGISSAVSLFSVVALLNKLCSEIFRVK